DKGGIMLPKKPEARTFCLLCVGLRSGVVVLKSGRDYKIGRTAETEITLPHHEVSRQHAEIVAKSPEVWAVRDLKSANGTFVNGLKLAAPEHRLNDQDEIGVGPFKLTFRAFSGDLEAILEEASAETDATA